MIERVKKGKSQAKTQAKSKGDLFYVYLYVNDELFVEGKLSLSGLTTSTDDWRGIVILKENTKNEESLKNYSVALKDNKIMIPYRHFNDNFKYGNPYFASKYIVSTFNSFGKSNNFKIKFEYNVIGWAINDDEGNSIEAALNKNKNNAKSKIGDLISTASNGAHNYVTAKQLMDKKKTDSDAKATEISYYEKRMKDRGVEIEQNNANMESTKSKAVTAENEKTKLEREATEIQQEISNYARELVRLTQKEEFLNTQTESISVEQSKIYEAGQLKKFNDAIKSLEYEVPLAKDVIKAAVDAIQGESKDIETCKTKINSIYP